MRSAPQGLIRTPLVDDSGNINRAWLYFLLQSEFDKLPVFANNAAAKSGGLKPGMPYRTGADPDAVCVVH